MQENAPETGQAFFELPMPDRQLAQHVSRELEWAERLEGAVFDPGPGQTAQRIYRLKVLSSFLDQVRGFRVELPVLQLWLRESVGDSALADAVDMAIAGENSEVETVAPADPRETVAALIRLRVQQCQEVLEPAVEGDQGGE